MSVSEKSATKSVYAPSLSEAATISVWSALFWSSDMGPSRFLDCGDVRHLLASDRSATPPAGEDWVRRSEKDFGPAHEPVATSRLDALGRGRPPARARRGVYRRWG